MTKSAPSDVLGGGRIGTKKIFKISKKRLASIRNKSEHTTTPRSGNEIQTKGLVIWIASLESSWSWSESPGNRR